MNTQPSILVIDDEPNNFDVIETLLARENYQFHYAPSGQRAIDRLDRFHPDVILLDVMMPDLDGIEVCRRIKAMPKWQSVPIVMVTALTAKEDLAECLAAGADDFISKPVNSLELRARVHSMLRIKQQHDSIKELLQRQENTSNLLQKHLEELQGNVVRALPHELNTPLNGMLGMVDLLIEDYENMEADNVQEMLRDLKVSTQRMERLTKRFLTYVKLQLTTSDRSRLETVRAQQHSTAVYPLILEIAKAKAVEANRADDLLLDIEDARVIINSQDLQLTLEEILDNAFKFSSLGMPVKIVGRAMKDQFFLSVSNQGRGITPEEIAQVGLFMQFGRKKYEQQGAGLGLAIIKEITNIYKGKFSISSVPDAETSVDITLPLNLMVAR